MVFQTSSVNLEVWDPSCEGCDLPRRSGRRGGSDGGVGGSANGPCDVTGVRAGPGRTTGTTLSRGRCKPIWPSGEELLPGNVGVPGPP